MNSEILRCSRLVRSISQIWGLLKLLVSFRDARSLNLQCKAISAPLHSRAHKGNNGGFHPEKSAENINSGLNKKGRGEKSPLCLSANRFRSGKEHIGKLGFLAHSRGSPSFLWGLEWRCMAGVPKTLSDAKNGFYLSVPKHALEEFKRFPPFTILKIFKEKNFASLWLKEF